MAGIGQNPPQTQMRGNAPMGAPAAQHRQVPGASEMEGAAMTPEMVAVELDRIPTPTLAKLKRKLGMAGRDLASMTPEEQTRLLQLFRRGATRPWDGQPGPGTIPPTQQQAAPLPLPPAGQNNQQMYAPPPHAGPSIVLGPLIPPNGMLAHPGQFQGMQFNGPPTTPAHNPMLGYGAHAPPHMGYPYPMTPVGMQLGQGTANPRIHQNMLQPTMPVGAPPRSSNQPLGPLLPPFAEDLDPELSSTVVNMDLGALTTGLASGLNIDAIRAAWLEGLSIGRETPR